MEGDEDMYMLYWKKPTPVFNGKTGYVMTWRGQHLAMCAERKPLEDMIERQSERPDRFYIEEWPD